MIGFGRLLGALVLAVVLLSTRAQAMEGMDMSGSSNMCPLMAGMHEMHLSAYQGGAFEEYCMTIPHAGPVTISIDAVSPEIRDMTKEIRVVKGKADAVGDLTEATVFHLPPQHYPAGTATFDATLPEPGNYTLLVTLRDDHGMEMLAKMPLSVGATFSPGLIVWLLFGGAIIASFGVYLYMVNRRPAKAAKSG
jgi:hypothetical protein